MINAVSDVLALTKSLIKCQSVTPEDAGCQDLLSVRLKALDFKIEKVDFADVQNLWAKRGTASPLFVFLGHTDVVPPGPGADWLSPAFEPTVKDGYLFGRGAADMKGNIAAFVVACERFVSLNPQHKGSIALLLTSDEEGPAVNGTVRVLEQLAQRQEKIDYCLVGEPSSAEKVGDVLKNGRRGSFHGRLYVEGIQGHVAYPELAANPIHSVVAGLAELCARQWDKGNEFFPATSFQISNIKSGTGAENVIPGGLECWFNFRFSTESTPEQLKKVVHEILDKHGIKYSIDWRLSGAPFLTAEGVLLDAIKESIKEVNGSEPQLSTAGGTSDGRFVAPYGVQVVELGLVNSNIHKVNESVCVEDLETLSRIYQLTLEKILL